MRALLLKLSTSERLARMVTSNGMSRRMSRRFVPGETLDEAVSAARTLNRAGMTVSLDYLGENVSSEADARRACDTYIGMYDCIAREKLDANVSLKLTQLGLDLGSEVCRGLIEQIAAHAAGQGNFLRVDMEGSAYTQRTLDLVRNVRAKIPPSALSFNPICGGRSRTSRI